MQLRRMTAAPQFRVEQPAQEGEQTRYISGYAVVFDQLSKPFWDEWVEKLDRHAFDQADMSDVRMVVDHGYSVQSLLARSHDGAGTLAITIDEYGVAFRFAVPDTSTGRDLVTLIERGDVSECSFAFYTEADQWDYADKEAGRMYDTRTVLRVAKLIDMSIVVSGQYGQTSVSVDERAAATEMRRAARRPRLHADLAAGIIDSFE